jgi:hypothetical protein
MTALPHPALHPVARAAHRWCDELGGVVGVPLWSMSPTEAGETLVALTRARAQLDALLMGVLSHAETVDTGSESGATTAVNWWSHHTRTTRLEAHRTARLAAALARHDPVRDALAAGEVVTEQARVIVEAVDVLPDEVASWVPVKATEHLLEKARDHDAKALRLLARRLLEVIDPAAADAEEARPREGVAGDARRRPRPLPRTVLDPVRGRGDAPQAPRRDRLTREGCGVAGRTEGRSGSRVRIGQRRGG